MKRNLSAFAAWGLSFGYAVGWGAFVMPGAAFLPDAGPVGTVLGILIGAAVMAVIGWNYYKMVLAYPGPAGACRYAHEAFGADYGFLTGWSLSLAYMAILWANATALVLLVRYLFGDVLQFGWHDTLAGFDIYLGEVLFSVGVMVVAGLVCIYGRRLAGRVQAVLALFMLVAVSAIFFMALSRHEGGVAAMAPAFVPGAGSHLAQVMRILAMMPWAFVGFEAISHSSSEFRFPSRRLFGILLAAIAASAAMYAMLAVLPVLSHPGEYSTWVDYIGARSGLSGLDSMPTFAAAHGALGRYGVSLIGAAMFAGILTGIIAAIITMSRLLYSISRDAVLPRWRWLGRLDGNGLPRNAILFVVGISLVIPFFGRTVIGWPVDVSSIGAAVAFCLTSAAAFKHARKNGDLLTRVTGLVGAVISVLFCLLMLVPNYLSGSSLSAEAYLVLAVWCILGFMLYRLVFRRDGLQRFGHSPIVWIGVVVMIFFSSFMWVRLSGQLATRRTADLIVACQAHHCIEHHGGANLSALDEEQAFVTDEMDRLNDEQLGYDIVQMVLLASSLIIIFNLYSIQRRRQQELKVAHAKAEARDRAKSSFLSSVSHDIRTPLNAIIGYIELAKRAGDDISKVREYVGKMEASSNHLLALITDILEMSRIESGREELEPVPLDLGAVLDEVVNVFSAQMAEKKIKFSVDASGIVHRHVMCDRNRLNRILLNLISNAWKFTPSGGVISVAMKEVGDVYELRIKDNGLGMSPEFKKSVFDPFERERTSAVKGIEGTGLGMPITKGIVTLMGGTIDVESEQGKGTEFIVRIPLKRVTGKSSIDAAALITPANPAKAAKERRITRILLVEDNEINREIAYTLLSQAGFAVDQAEDGNVAVEKFSRGGPGHYDAILMDVHMPTMDGYTATRTIRAMELPGDGRVPIIALSANAFESDVKDALAAGMDAHVAKPIRISTLMKTLDEVMSRANDPISSLIAMGCDIEKTLSETYVGDKAFYLKMLAKLPANTAFGKMRDAIAEGDVNALFAASHNMKGVYASLGLTPLYALCSEIVEISRGGSFDGAAERMIKLEKMHNAVLKCISQLK